VRSGMARKLRLEFPGACYHVINRGNYKRAIFGADGTAGSFEKALFEGCESYNWRLHAYVIMRNHFHLALETPEANLSSGMKWLQGTFAVRFNRYFDQVGRPFQGRFKSLIVEPGHALAQVAHYIHLNPVRARICPADRVADYRYSSLGKYLTSARPDFLVPTWLLAQAGNLKDTRHGWRKYQQTLAWIATDDSLQKEMRFSEMCNGWCRGSESFEEAMENEYALESSKIRTIARGGPESLALLAIRQKQWQGSLNAGAKYLKIELSELPRPKSAPVKVALAAAMRSATSASNQWLAEKLQMGKAASVSQFVRRFRLAENQKTSKFKILLSRVKQ
jgi:putative transposase